MKGFLSMHGVSNGRLDQASKAQEAANVMLHYGRKGRYEPENKTKRHTVERITTHINTFPIYQSNYSWKDNPNQEFLNPYLSFHRMYQL